ncbi:MAG: type II toxin-antitoxin system RelE/ParE family toxin [Coriobacteriia bacterium]|nr:type II toxin-antitoxin system RelE/ParE family toxin [Coriobacteriia bacterium]
MEYRIEFAPSASKQFAKLPREMQRRLAPVIDALALDPRPEGCVRLAGTAELWRVRVGVYRVVYTIEDDRLVVLVVKVGHRRDVCGPTPLRTS